MREEFRNKRANKHYALFRLHPMSVHFTMALVPFALLMNLFCIIRFNDSYFFHAGYFSVVCAFIAIFFATGTGILSWRINFIRGAGVYFRLKIVFTIVIALMLSAEIFFVRGFLYNTMLFLNIVPLAIIGFSGGRITWSITRT